MFTDVRCNTHNNIELLTKLYNILAIIAQLATTVPKNDLLWQGGEVIITRNSDYRIY